MVKEVITKSLSAALAKYDKGAVIMMELPTDSYLEANLASVSLLVQNGFEGIYVSFQRPFKNIEGMFRKEGINTGKLMFIDVATSFEGIKQEGNARCVHLEPGIQIDDLVRSIYTSLPKLKGNKKFIFVDSLTTITLYKPLSEIMRFSEFLIRTVKKQEVQEVILIFNVAEDLSQRKFIRDIALRVDEVISVIA